mmetsp:Transcript_6792/g.10943  ORF Transcript_6792/g.10943 Transcript_6792/m.10943 type:complete len:96 (-) Transcript_6792:1869-2156(-)
MHLNPSSVLTSNHSSLEDSSSPNHKRLPHVDEVSTSNENVQKKLDEISNEECLDDQFSKVFSLIESLSDKLQTGLKETNDKTEELSEFLKQHSVD